MKHKKLLALIVSASVFLAGFISSASATVLTSPAGTEYTGEVQASLSSGTSSAFKAGIEDTCTGSSMSGNVTTNDTTVNIAIFGIITTGCSKTTDVLKTGSLRVASGGAVTASGNETTVFDLGISCVYGGGTGTKLGTLTGGTTAVLEVNTTELQKISGGFLCASKGTWTAKYTVTTPDTLLVD